MLLRKESLSTVFVWIDPLPWITYSCIVSNKMVLPSKVARRVAFSWRHLVHPVWALSQRQALQAHLDEDRPWQRFETMPPTLHGSNRLAPPGAHFRRHQRLIPAKRSHLQFHLTAKHPEHVDCALFWPYGTLEVA